jgi:transcriptional regulator with XRE-family HTH domain
MALLRKRNRLREVRKAKGLSALDLQLMTPINHQRIYLIERGIVKPTHAQKVILSEALGVPLEQLFPADMSRNQDIIIEA